MDTSRQRFQKTMSYAKPDRVPYFEEGIRKDVLKAWHQQGLPRNKKLWELFPTDRFEEIILNMEPGPGLKKWPTNSRDLNRLRDSLNPDDPNRLPKNWKRKVRYWQNQDIVLMLRVFRGFFLSMGVNDWDRFTDLIYLIKDDPDLIRETLRIQGEFAARLTENVLKDINIDAAVFTEPIGGNEGPIISPADYKNIVLPTYKPIFDVLHRKGIKTIIFKTYANTRVLIPHALNFGFNCVWACEVNNPEMDYPDMRKEFGPDLRLIGGIDLDALRGDKEMIRKEVEEKVPDLIAQGGYIPLADGRVRKEIPFENYLYYRRLLEKI